MASAAEILAPVLPSFGIFKIIFWAVVVVPLVAYLVWLWVTRMTRPIKYHAVIFELIGGTFRSRPGKVLYKRKKGQEGYYVVGFRNKQGGIELKHAILSSKGKSVFRLLKIEDKFIPLTLSKKVNTILEKGKLPINLTVENFLAKTKIQELEHAILETIETDAKRYRWVDKLGALLSVGVPAMVLLMAFLLVAWSVKEIGAITAAQKTIVGEFAGIKSSFVSIAESFEGISQYYGAVKPPPG